MRPRPRRQSTLDLASPGMRKQRYDTAIQEHLVDVFCTIHIPEEEEPVYITETVEECMNVDFRFFDLKSSVPSTSRSSLAVINIWVKPHRDAVWQHLQDSHVDLKSLVLVARSADALQETFSDNTLLLHLSDGVYALQAGQKQPLPSTTAPPPLASSSVGLSEPCSSYDALMRLQTLESCLADAFQTRDRLISEINYLLTSDKTSSRFSVPTELTVARDSLATTKRAVDAAQRNLKSSRAAIASSRFALETRREAMSSGTDSSDHARSYLQSASQSLDACRSTHQTTQTDITGQRRRIVSDLQSIFPIEPLPNFADGTVFAIRGCALPASSDFSNINAYARPTDAEVSAALGHAAQLVRLLSLYLFIPLPYPISPRSSLSIITDPISIMPKQEFRNYPLYTGHHVGAAASVLSRFEYAVYLLNKNIEILMQRSGTRPMDIRQTLANLGLLMFALSGGGRPDDVPPRFRGAVRGLGMTRRGLARTDSWSSDAGLEVSNSLSERRGSWGGAGKAVTKASEGVGLGVPTLSS